MAQKVNVIVTDDLDGHEGDDVTTYLFSVGKVAYEIDLGEKNAKKFDAALALYISKARPAGRTATPAGSNGTRRTGRTTHVPAPRDRASRDRGRQIRIWAGEQGIPCGDRGRIPRDVEEKYDAAHPF